MHFRWESIDPGNVPETFLKELGKPDMDYPAPYQWIEQGLELAENAGFPFAELRIDSLAVRDSLLSGRMAYQQGPYIT